MLQSVLTVWTLLGTQSVAHLGDYDNAPVHGTICPYRL
jgi:hypothetical protein